MQTESNSKQNLGQMIEGQFVEIDGASMHYVHAGAGRPLVLIHGLVGSAANWNRNIDALAHDASVYAIDLINMGKSQRVAGLDPSLAATADRVAAWMGAVGLTDADVGAHSHGGAVALMLAARHPERVRSLILFAPVNPFSNRQEWMVRLYSSPIGRRIAQVEPYLPRQLQLLSLRRMYGDPARLVENALPGYIEGLRVPGTIDHVLAIVRGWASDMAELRTALPRIAHIPTLLLWGDRDRAVSLESGIRLHRELPGSELAVMKGGGHVLYEELPAQCNRKVRRWLRGDHARRPEDIPILAQQPDRGRPKPVAPARTPLSAVWRHLSAGS